MQEKNIKILGVVVILIGLAILLFTFYQAYNSLNSPPPSLRIPESTGTGSSAQPDINRAITQAFSPFFNSVLPLAYSTGYLLVMGLVGFWIMGRGIQLVK